MSEQEIVCPLCNGKGVTIIKRDSGNRFADHPNRRLPLDYFCKYHKQFVTKSHGNSYGHWKYMVKVKK